MLDAVRVDAGEGNLAIGAGRIDAGNAGRRVRSDPDPDLDIDVPAAASVVVEVSGSDVRVDGLRGEQRYRTASGDVVLRAVRGRLTVETMSGDVDLASDGPASVDVRSESGDVDLTAEALDHLLATTTSGDLRLIGRVVGPGPHRLQTVSGDTVLAPVGDVRFDISTIAGDVRSDVPSRMEEAPGLRSILIGAGAPTVEVRSTSGDIRVVDPDRVHRRARQTSPTPPTAPTPPVAPSPPTPPTPPTATVPGDSTDEARLAILRDLELGRIDLESARRRLDDLERPVAPDGRADGTTVEAIDA